MEGGVVQINNSLGRGMQNNFYTQVSLELIQKTAVEEARSNTQAKYPRLMLPGKESRFRKDIKTTELFAAQASPFLDWIADSVRAWTCLLPGILAHKECVFTEREEQEKGDHNLKQEGLFKGYSQHEHAKGMWLYHKVHILVLFCLDSAA